MCGIAGIIDFAGRAVDEGQIERLTESVRHRGPDDGGVHTTGSIGLGNRRLAVIDLSQAGHQPMCDASGDIWLTYNGEIYNFKELRRQLGDLGHQFSTGTDTEVILAAYREWGQDCVNYFAGMFAFALWDGATNTLFAARDRLGVKPLYYSHQDQRLILSSESHGLYETVRPSLDSIDPVSLDYYLAFGYTPPDRGFVSGINKLPPGHIMSACDGRLKIEKYWEPSTLRATAQFEIDDAVEEVESRLKGAVTRRLVADVPLGFFLSGGIDSGLVAAMAAEATDEPIKTFTARFPGIPQGQSEHHLARLTAERLGAEHIELEVNSNNRDLLPSLISHFAEPFADISMLPTYQIARATREHVTVALSGDGGDESFAGYANVRAAHVAERFRKRVPRPARTAIHGAAMATSAIGFSSGGRAVRWLHQYVDADAVSQYDLQNHWSHDRRLDLYAGDAGRAEAVRTLINEVQAAAPELDDAALHMYTDLRLRLPGDYLPKVDITSGMASLEVRSPFLDHGLVEFAATLPTDLRLHGGNQKALLRRLSEKYLPAEITAAPKRGFAPPLSHWLMTDWRDLISDVVGRRLVERDWILDGAVVQRYVAEHLSGEVDHTQRIWNLIVLELWIEIFVDRTLSADDRL